MFVPPDENIVGVVFYKDTKEVGKVGFNNERCIPTYLLPTEYVLACASLKSFTLTIPASLMTISLQNSVWYCSHYGIGSVRSPDATLSIASKNTFSREMASLSLIHI